MQNNQQDITEEGRQFPSLLPGAGFALASLIILQALAQRVGIGARLSFLRADRAALPEGGQWPAAGGTGAHAADVLHRQLVQPE